MSEGKINDMQRGKLYEDNKEEQEFSRGRNRNKQRVGRERKGQTEKTQRRHRKGRTRKR